jgi:transcriptional regulator with XRE-family HTH domain
MVPRIVRTLMAARATTPTELAEHLGIGRSSLSERMNGHRRFTLAEVAEMSSYFGVSPAIFFGHPDDLIRSAVGGSGANSGCVTADRTKSLIAV